jgi:hypothetical protein
VSVLSKLLSEMMEKDATKLCSFQMDPAHTDATSDGEPIAAEKHYFRLRVTEMYLAHSRKWGTEFYPAVHALTRFRFGDAEVDIPNAIDPLALPGVETSADVVIKRDDAMTALLPFHGGTVGILAGLLAMQGANHPQAFLSAMADCAKLLVVPQLPAAIQIAAPVASGIQKMMGAMNGRLHLGLHETLTGQSGAAKRLCPGYLVAIGAEEQQVRRNQLWIVGGQLRAGTSAAASRPYQDYDHIVFQVEEQPGRDDYDSLPSVRGP